MGKEILSIKGVAMRGLLEGIIVACAVVAVILFFFTDINANPLNHYHFCGGNKQCMADQAWAKQAWENTRISNKIKYNCGGLYIGRTESTADYYGALNCARSATETDIMVEILSSRGYRVIRK